MTNARRDGLYLLLLGSVVFLLLGVVLLKAAPAPLADFRAVYYPSRCLIQHHDPYMESEVRRIYELDEQRHPSDTAVVRQIATQDVYPPTAFLVTTPFAMLPWGPAGAAWITLNVAIFLLAVLLTWSLGADSAPLLSGALIGLLVANSELLVITGNVAGIAIGLCLVAVWCFLRDRFVPLGVLSLAISLAVKPHEAGLVWLYFLLAGGAYLRRALQTLLATAAIGVPGVLWTWSVAPNWMQEWRSNLLRFSAHGGINDPGLASSGGHGLDMVVSLQKVVSFFRDDPRFYNPVTWLVCAPLLLAWAAVTVRTRFSPARAWLALAAVAAFSMLPVYHRQVDAKLLLLTVPACALLWAEGGLTRWLALLVNAAGFVLIADLPWAVFFALIHSPHLPATGLSGQLLTAAQVFPVPFILLVMGIFYLWVYARSARHPVDRGSAQSC